MTPTAPIRPVLAALLAASLSACGMVEADPHRFETMAESIAAIPLDGAARQTVVRTANEMGLRGSAEPATAAPALRVEVMDPHDLWDARDAGLRGAIEQAAPRMIEAAAPAMAEAVMQQVSHRVEAVAAMRPAIARRTTSRVESTTQPALVQLGAFSSEGAARTAWTRLKAGAAGRHLSGLTPVFEPVRRNGATLTRLKAAVPTAGAGAVCAAARIDAPWCRRDA